MTFSERKRFIQSRFNVLRDAAVQRETDFSTQSIPDQAWSELPAKDAGPLQMEAEPAEKMRRSA